MREALKLLRWVLTDMVYTAPEAASDKLQIWISKLQRAEELLNKPDQPT